MGNDAKHVDKDAVFTNYQPITSKVFFVSLLVEFLGVCFFQFLGGSVNPKSPMVPWVNGLALAVWVYTAANISGGHLNPAVTMSTLLCGFYPVLHSILYIFLQISGAIFGALFSAGLVAGSSIGMGDGGPGCFDHKGIHPKLTNAQIFGWEALMTFTLISVVYACGVAKPGHGSFTPLAVGLSLVACAGAGGEMTGAALNPARVIGPLAVFHCGKDVAWLYILAQIMAATCACCIFAFVSGLGPLNPLTSMGKLGLSWPESINMWLTGSPPARLSKSNQDNVTDLMRRADRAEEARDSAKEALKVKESLDAKEALNDV